MAKGSLYGMKGVVLLLGLLVNISSAKQEILDENVAENDNEKLRDVDANVTNNYQTKYTNLEKRKADEKLELNDTGQTAQQLTDSEDNDQNEDSKKLHAKTNEHSNLQSKDTQASSISNETASIKPRAHDESLEREDGQKQQPAITVNTNVSNLETNMMKLNDTQIKGELTDRGWKSPINENEHGIINANIEFTKHAQEEERKHPGFITLQQTDEPITEVMSDTNKNIVQSVELKERTKKQDPTFNVPKENGNTNGNTTQDPFALNELDQNNNPESDSSISVNAVTTLKERRQPSQLEDINALPKNIKQADTLDLTTFRQKAKVESSEINTPEMKLKDIIELTERSQIANEELDELKQTENQPKAMLDLTTLREKKWGEVSDINDDGMKLRDIIELTERSQIANEELDELKQTENQPEAMLDLTTLREKAEGEVNVNNDDGMNVKDIIELTERGHIANEELNELTDENQPELMLDLTTLREKKGGKVSDINDDGMKLKDIMELTERSQVANNEELDDLKKNENQPESMLDLTTLLAKARNEVSDINDDGMKLEDIIELTERSQIANNEEPDELKSNQPESMLDLTTLREKNGGEVSDINDNGMKLQDIIELTERSQIPNNEEPDELKSNQPESMLDLTTLREKNGGEVSDINDNGMKLEDIIELTERSQIPNNEEPGELNRNQPESKLDLTTLREKNGGEVSDINDDGMKLEDIIELTERSQIPNNEEPDELKRNQPESMLDLTTLREKNGGEVSDINDDGMKLEDIIELTERSQIPNNEEPGELKINQPESMLNLSTHREKKGSEVSDINGDGMKVKHVIELTERSQIANEELDDLNKNENQLEDNLELTTLRQKVEGKGRTRNDDSIKLKDVIELNERHGAERNKELQELNKNVGKPETVLDLTAIQQTAVDESNNDGINPKELAKRRKPTENEESLDFNTAQKLEKDLVDYTTHKNTVANISGINYTRTQTEPNEQIGLNNSIQQREDLITLTTPVPTKFEEAVEINNGGSKARNIISLTERNHVAYNGDANDLNKTAFAEDLVNFTNTGVVKKAEIIDDGMKLTERSTLAEHSKSLAKQDISDVNTTQNVQEDILDLSTLQQKTGKGIQADSSGDLVKDKVELNEHNQTMTNEELEEFIKIGEKPRDLTVLTERSIAATKENLNEQSKSESPEELLTDAATGIPKTDDIIEINDSGMKLKDVIELTERSQLELNEGMNDLSNTKNQEESNLDLITLQQKTAGSLSETSYNGMALKDVTELPDQSADTLNHNLSDITEMERLDEDVLGVTSSGQTKADEANEINNSGMELKAIIELTERSLPTAQDVSDTLKPQEVLLDLSTLRQKIEGREGIDYGMESKDITKLNERSITEPIVKLDELTQLKKQPDDMLHLTSIEETIADDANVINNAGMKLKEILELSERSQSMPHEDIIDLHINQKLKDGMLDLTTLRQKTADGTDVYYSGIKPEFPIELAERSQSQTELKGEINDLNETENPPESPIDFTALREKTVIQDAGMNQNDITELAERSHTADENQMEYVELIPKPTAINITELINSDLAERSQSKASEEVGIETGKVIIGQDGQETNKLNHNSAEDREEMANERHVDEKNELKPKLNERSNAKEAVGAGERNEESQKYELAERKQNKDVEAVSRPNVNEEEKTNELMARSAQPSHTKAVTEISAMNDKEEIQEINSKAVIEAKEHHTIAGTETIKRKEEKQTTDSKPEIGEKPDTAIAIEISEQTGGKGNKELQPELVERMHRTTTVEATEGKQGPDAKAMPEIREENGTIENPKLTDRSPTTEALELSEGNEKIEPKSDLADGTERSAGSQGKDVPPELSERTNKKESEAVSNYEEKDNHKQAVEEKVVAKPREPNEGKQNQELKPETVERLQQHVGSNANESNKTPEPEPALTGRSHMNLVEEATEGNSGKEQKEQNSEFVERVQTKVAREVSEVKEIQELKPGLSERSHTDTMVESNAGSEGNDDQKLKPGLIEYSRKAAVEPSDGNEDNKNQGQTPELTERSFTKEDAIKGNQGSESKARKLEFSANALVEPTEENNSEKQVEDHRNVTSEQNANADNATNRMFSKETTFLLPKSIVGDNLKNNISNSMGIKTNISNVIEENEDYSNEGNSDESGSNEANSAEIELTTDGKAITNEPNLNEESTETSVANQLVKNKKTKKNILAERHKKGHKGIRKRKNKFQYNRHLFDKRENGLQRKNAKKDGITKRKLIRLSKDDTAEKTTEGLEFSDNLYAESQPSLSLQPHLLLGIAPNGTQNATHEDLMQPKLTLRRLEIGHKEDKQLRGQLIAWYKREIDDLIRSFQEEVRKKRAHKLKRKNNVDNAPRLAPRRFGDESSEEELDEDSKEDSQNKIDALGPKDTKMSKWYKNTMKALIDSYQDTVDILQINSTTAALEEDLRRASSKPQPSLHDFHEIQNIQNQLRKGREDLMWSIQMASIEPNRYKFICCQKNAPKVENGWSTVAKESHESNPDNTLHNNWPTQEEDNQQDDIFDHIAGLEDFIGENGYFQQNFDHTTTNEDHKQEYYPELKGKHSGRYKPGRNEPFDVDSDHKQKHLYQINSFLNEAQENLANVHLREPPQRHLKTFPYRFRRPTYEDDNANGHLNSILKTLHKPLFQTEYHRKRPNWKKQMNGWNPQQSRRRKWKKMGRMQLAINDRVSLE